MTQTERRIVDTETSIRDGDDVARVAPVAISTSVPVPSAGPRCARGSEPSRGANGPVDVVGVVAADRK